METVDWLSDVLVVGGGTMGRGIAQVLLEPGYNVTLVDPDEAARAKAVEAIEDGLEKRDCPGRIELLSTSETIPKEGEYQLGVEAVPEQLSLKQTILSRMEPHVTDMLASNTSSIPLADLDHKLDDHYHFIGLHFMNPAPVMPLVELVEHPGSDMGFIKQAEDLIKSLDKTAARVMDCPGFVSNRLLMGLINRAIRLVEQRIASPQAIDQIMKMGMSHEMGPIEVADFIGLDVCLETMHIINERVDDSDYQPPELLETKVDEGKLGRKTGEGFYSY